MPVRYAVMARLASRKAHSRTGGRGRLDTATGCGVKAAQATGLLDQLLKFIHAPNLTYPGTQVQRIVRKILRSTAMRTYITGIAGFLGSHLADWLTAEGHEVTGCDDFSTGNFANIQGHHISVIDISDYRMVKALTKEMHGCDILYHCAAAAYEGLSVFSPGYISQNIYAGSANVFAAAAAAGVRRIVFCSSMSRYGKGDPPFREWQAARPVDPYALAKLTAERLLRQQADVHGFEWSIAVPHNIYGPRQKYDDPYRNVAAIMVNRVLQGLPPLIYGDGSQVRCFSYVDDVVPCLGRMGLEQAPVSQIINLGPDSGEMTILELAEIVCEATGSASKFVFMPPRPCEVHHATCSADKARKLLGFEARVPFRSGIEKLVQYVRERGPKEFEYRLDVEIVTEKTPKTWTEKLI